MSYSTPAVPVRAKCQRSMLSSQCVKENSHRGRCCLATPLALYVNPSSRPPPPSERISTRTVQSRGFFAESDLAVQHASTIRQWHDRVASGSRDSRGILLREKQINASHHAVMPATKNRYATDGTTTKVTNTVDGFIASSAPTLPTVAPTDAQLLFVGAGVDAAVLEVTAGDPGLIAGVSEALCSDRRVATCSSKIALARRCTWRSCRMHARLNIFLYTLYIWFYLYFIKYEKLGCLSIIEMCRMTYD